MSLDYDDIVVLDDIYTEDLEIARSEIPRDIVDSHEHTVSGDEHYLENDLAPDEELNFDIGGR